MDHQSLILGELREFKRAALADIADLKKGMGFLQRAEATRKGKSLAFSAIGGFFGAALMFLAELIWR